MAELGQPVVSAALTAALAKAKKQDTALQDMLGSTLVQKEVPTEETPEVKPKRTRKKTVD